MALPRLGRTTLRPMLAIVNRYRLTLFLAALSVDTMKR